MPETVNMLETILENEAALFLKLVTELENDDLYEFIRRVAEVEPQAGHSATDDILRVAQNVKGIEAALENFYRV
jgi:hypothetical protein